jgi:hypothetical protein
MRDFKDPPIWWNRSFNDPLVLGSGAAIGSGVEEDSRLAFNSRDMHSDSEVRAITISNSAFDIESVICISDILLWIVNESVSYFVVTEDALNSCFHGCTSSTFGLSVGS